MNSINRTSLTFEDVTPEGSGEAAAQFIDAWFRETAPDALAGLTLMRAAGGVRQTICLPRSELAAELRASGIEALVHAGGEPHNLYVNTGVLREKPASKRRGGKSNVAAVLGTWLDLDTKPGSFRDLEQAYSFVTSLGVPPTLMVETGSGGLHGYWRLPAGGSLTVAEGERLGLAWWAHALEVADGIEIDKLCTADRLMRLPGSVRWPKKGEASSVVRFRTDGSNESVPRAELERVAGSALERLLEGRRVVQRVVAQSYGSAAELAAELQGRTGLGRLAAFEDLIESYNEDTSWDDILEPHGWVHIGDDYDERRKWARPGGDGMKSATTDWPSSPHVLSLFSRAPETGLLELHDAGVVLTKWRVATQLDFNGNEAAMVRELLS